MKHPTPTSPTAGSIPSALLNVDLAELASGEPWEDALKRGDFDAALSDIERVLNEERNGTSATARLWWARCQLQTNRVPLTALTAPVDEIFPAIKRDPKLQLLGCSTLALLSAKLTEKGQTRLGLVLLGNAFDLAAVTDAVSESTHQALGEAYAQAIDSELLKIEGKKDPKGYAASLKKQREGIRAGTKRGVKVTPSAPAAAPPEERSFIWGDREFPDSTPTVVAEPLPPAPPVKAEPKRVHLVSIIASVVVILVLLGSWDAVFVPAHLSDEEGEPGYLLAMHSPALGAPEQAFKLPRLTPRSSDAIFEKLGSLGNNLDLVGERLKNIGGAKETRSAEEIRSDPDVDTAALEGKEGKALRLAKAPPREDDELESFGAPKAEPTLSAERAPLLNPDRLAQLPVENVGTTPYRAPIEDTAAPPTAQLPSGQLPPAQQPRNDSVGPLAGRRDTEGLRMGPDGQMYGPPRDATSPLITREVGTSIDGQPVRSYEVQRYPEPVLFRTIASTQVLSAPSFLATSIARLAPDTSIQVVSRMGQWLELRSIGGARGFILAQDAKEAR